MPNTTTNYNLTKPLETERYDVQVFNNNADIIDTQMKSNADGIANVNSRLDNLNNWTTVEFTLADFTYDENSRVTHLPIEVPSGYEFEEVRGYIILNKNEADNINTYITIEPTIPNYDNNINTDNACNVLTVGMSNTGCINRVDIDYNQDFKYTTCIGSYAFSTRATVQTVGYSPAIRTRSIFNNAVYSSSRIVIKTNTPYTNISELYGKLQYRVVPAS